MKRAISLVRTYGRSDPNYRKALLKKQYLSINNPPIKKNSSIRYGCLFPLQFFTLVLVFKIYIKNETVVNKLLNYNKLACSSIFTI